mmetsp:Transcript_32357/g.70634  ORF Transcript_32357/g.70634 Transcript_32357/m.70634 type:complete len:82 (+) Transcript_32357:97-342(+)|eukprot:CAMPEP_0118930824 /NCGR_PEP_ID=MMETSP1169-20130426/7383_1 /TAXON_ID=36882 /ORGANISM="Pyramimonas obovata, Strain CCMP722" /LENGTH=81 /DNA_ID=CAMNT_0006873239 /DNA_START=78 /DNA_END=323 /DNA_ORIENTATION=+
MSFLMDFARTAVEAYMEKPDERNKAVHDHIRLVKAKCDEIIADRSKSQKVYGFWANSSNNTVFTNQREPALAKAPGRTAMY